MKNTIPFIIAACFALLTSGIPYVAAEGSHKGHEKGHHPGKMCLEKECKHHKMGVQGKKDGMHFMGALWKKTLTEDQKKQFDQMHLALKKEKTVLNAQKDLKKAELHNLIVQDNVEFQIIKAKIKEILDIKRSIMEKKYSHMVEMREALTPEQRISFDMGVLGRSGKARKKHQ